MKIEKSAREVSELTLVRIPELMDELGIRSRVTVWQWIKGQILPAPIDFGPGTRLVAWRRQDIARFLAERAGRTEAENQPTD